MQKKQQKLEEKKKKAEKRQQILTQLAQIQLSQEQMANLNSIKEATSGIKKERKKSTNIKSIEVEEQPQVQQSKVNIFATTIYENENPVKIEQRTHEQKISEAERLEIIAKQLFPDMSLESFDQKRIQQGQIPQSNKEIINDYDPTQDDIYDLGEDIHYDTLLNDQNDFKPPETLIRSEEIMNNRKLLPILAQESEIIDAIKGNLITLISGETGCGKSTQIPQFLYEAGFAEFGAIALTQPRRLAAISLAQRVCEETNLTLGKQISYQVKHENSGIDIEKLKIKFMTDGILINEMQTSALLPQYSVILIDEAHERKVNIDLLIGVLSRIVIARAKIQKPLRLVIMSATLRLDDFLNNKYVFPRMLNLIKIQSRQYPVQVYFNKITKNDYVEAAIEKCIKIHNTLPPGDVLVFLTGQKEIQQCCSLLKDRLERESRNINNNEQLSDDDENDKNIVEEESVEEQQIEEEEQFDKGNYLELKNMNIATQNTNFKVIQQLSDFSVVPLYSKLDLKHQESIFHNESSKKRMFIIATNVAETSITIPTIRYVIDSGKQKRKITDSKIGLEKHVIGWISQAAADQRSGRAGRTGPGYCYRLYSTAVYSNQFKKFDEPEITQVAMDHIILQMKSIGIKDVFKFPYLTKPDLNHIKSSINELINLGALKQQEQIESDSSTITQLGIVLAQIPLNPKYGKFLLQTRIRGLLHYGILLVCILSVEEIINKSFFRVDTQIQQNQNDDDLKTLEYEQQIIEQQIKDQRQQNRNLKIFLDKYSSGCRSSDLFCLMNLIGNVIKQINDQQDIQKQIDELASQNHLISKQLREIYYNILQMIEIFNYIITDKNIIKECVDQIKNYKMPTIQEQQILVEIIIKTNTLSKIARLQSKIDVEHNTRKYYYQTPHESEVFIHPTSIFAGKSNIEFFSYQQLITFSDKIYLYNLTEVPSSTILYEMDTSSSQAKKLCIHQDSEHYDQKRDQLMCKANAVVNNWTLENLEVPFPKDQLTFYSKFARALYNGEIINFYLPMKKYYKYKITDIKESNMQPYSQKLIRSLMQNQIGSKKELLSKWQQDNKFLLNELLLFIQEPYHNIIQTKWPPVE